MSTSLLDPTPGTALGVCGTVGAGAKVEALSGSSQSGFLVAATISDNGVPYARALLAAGSAVEPHAICRAHSLQMVRYLVIVTLWFDGSACSVLAASPRRGEGGCHYAHETWFTAVHSAVMRQDEEVLRLLTEYGARGEWLKDLAVRMGKPGVLKVSLDAGASAVDSVRRRWEIRSA